MQRGDLTSIAVNSAKNSVMEKSTFQQNWIAENVLSKEKILIIVLRNEKAFLKYNVRDSVCQGLFICLSRMVFIFCEFSVTTMEEMGFPDFLNNACKMLFKWVGLNPQKYWHALPCRDF